MSKLRILNAYAGIGGNRLLWGDTHQITAVELDPKIALIYKNYFPKDNVIIADAHEYLLKHYSEFDFIWASPPCPTHSRLCNLTIPRGRNIRYPDMALYQEIIFLKHWFKGKWCVENVISYYEPLIKPFEINNHYFWTNFYISPIKNKSRQHRGSVEELSQLKGFNIEKYKGIDKRKTLRNCVEPKTGEHILKESMIDYQSQLFDKNVGRVNHI